MKPRYKFIRSERDSSFWAGQLLKVIQSSTRAIVPIKGGYMILEILP